MQVWIDQKLPISYRRPTATLTSGKPRPATVPSRLAICLTTSSLGDSEKLMMSGSKRANSLANRSGIWPSAVAFFPNARSYGQPVHS